MSYLDQFSGDRWGVFAYEAAFYAALSVLNRVPDVPLSVTWSWELCLEGLPRQVRP